MKLFTPYRKILMFKKLSSFNIIMVTVVNLALPLVLFLSGHYIADIQLRYMEVSNEAAYHFRVSLLCLLLAIVILGGINIICIVNPIISLENIVDEYGNLADIDEMNANDTYFTTSSLENMFLDMLNDQKQTIKRQYQAELLRQETELLALQSQINPHFLYNTLDSIRGLALIHNVTEIADMTEALSNLFRNMIAKEGQMILVEEEVENINNYMIIQQFRFRNRFTFKTEVADEIMKSYLVPNLTLQPIVENAIVHGLEQKRRGGEIFVKAFYTKKRLCLSVRDNGIGLKEEQLERLNCKLDDKAGINIKTDTKKHTGIALVNINQRIKLLFGEEYGVRIMSTPDIYTNVEIVLPLIPASSKEAKGFFYEE